MHHFKASPCMGIVFKLHFVINCFPHYSPLPASGPIINAKARDLSMCVGLCMKGVKARLSHSYFFELHCCKHSSGVVYVWYTYTVRSFPNHNNTVFFSHLCRGVANTHCCSDVSKDVCFCAWNKESAPQRIGRVTFPLFLVGL